MYCSQRSPSDLGHRHRLCVPPRVFLWLKPHFACKHCWPLIDVARPASIMRARGSHALQRRPGIRPALEAAMVLSRQSWLDPAEQAKDIVQNRSPGV